MVYFLYSLGDSVVDYLLIPSFHHLLHQLIPSFHHSLPPGTEDKPIDWQCVSQNSPSSDLYVYYLCPSNPGGITGLEGGWAVGV